MVLGEWIVHVISFQKILGSCGLNGHIMEIRLGVTLEDNGQRTKREDRAGTRICDNNAL